MSEERSALTAPQMQMLRKVAGGERWGSGTRATWKALVRRGMIDGSMLSPRLTERAQKFLAEHDAPTEPVQKIGDCPDCYGAETSEGCLRCDGTGTICDVCGESPEACPCPRP